MTAHSAAGVSMRSSSSMLMSAPPTQNTAPIIEHRCLYTHDIRRKAKRWQDGLLRFHTFNKRVMVYDFPARNYIGDTHWREECPVQDGDELQLDRPVLVQVCDQIGSVEQDLTELLESRRKKHVPAEEPAPRRALHAPQQGCHSPHGSLAALPSPPQPLQPKSLNALLGKSASKPGKAVLPAKSPYQIREESQLSRIRDGRPYKKARLENSAPSKLREDADNDPIVEHSANYQGHSHRHDCLSSRKPVSGHPEQLCGRNKPNASKTPASTSLAVAGVHAIPHTSRVSVAGSGESNAQHKRSQIQDANARDRFDINKSYSENDLPRRHNSPRSSPGPQDRSRASPHRSSDPPLTLEEHQAASSHQSPKPRSKLQMASRKPRRKLMYRDLLPPDELGASFEPPKTARISPAAARTRAPNPTVNDMGDTALPLVNESQLETHLSRQTTGSTFLSDEDMTNLEPHVVARRVPGNSPIYDKLANHEVATHKSPFDGNISENLSTEPTINASLEKVDEILANREVNTKASKQTRKQTQRHLQKDRDLSPSISITTPIPLEDTTASLEHQEDRDKSPILISSPEVEAGTVRLPGRAHKAATGDDNDLGAASECPVTQKDKSADLEEADKTPGHIGESLTNTSPVRPRRRAAATSLAEAPPPLRSTTSLPNFVPVRPTRRTRSPLKASMSENSMDAIDARRGQGAQPPHSGPCRAPVAEPWSREAWDLFGCSRDGVEVSYGEFCRQDGVV